MTDTLAPNAVTLSHVDRPALFAHFKAVFSEASADRQARPDIVEDPITGHPQIAWYVHERAQMHAAINAWRTERGLTPVTERAVARAEQMACGHSDYYLKYALYCADLAVDGDARAIRP